MAKSKSLLESARAISLDWAKRGRCKTHQTNEFFSPRWQPSQDRPIHRTHTTNGANESHDPAVHQGRTYIGQNAQDVNAGKRLLNRYKDLRRSKKLPCQILWSTIARICRAKERTASPDARMPSSETPPPADKASIQTSIEGQQEQIKPIYPSSSQLKDKQSSDGTEVEATNVKHQEKGPRHEIRAGPTSKKDKQQDAIAERSKDVAASEPATNEASSGLRTELHKVAVTREYCEESENAAMTADLQIGTRDDDAKAQKLADAPEPVLNAAPDIVRTKMKQEPAFKSPVIHLSDLVIRIPPTSSNTAHPYSARVLASPTTEAASANLAADDSLHREKTKTLGTKNYDNAVRTLQQHGSTSRVQHPSTLHSTGQGSPLLNRLDHAHRPDRPVHPRQLCRNAAVRAARAGRGGVGRRRRPTASQARAAYDRVWSEQWRPAVAAHEDARGELPARRSLGDASDRPARCACRQKFRIQRAAGLLVLDLGRRVWPWSHRGRPGGGDVGAAPPRSLSVLDGRGQEGAE